MTIKKRLFNGVIGIIKTGYHLVYIRPMSLSGLLRNKSKWCRHKSYYPHLQKKSGGRILYDQIMQIVKFRYPNEYYFPYGFDVKSKAEMDEYLHYAPFMRLRDSRNLKMHSATAVLRDKLLFGMFTSYYGIESSKNVAISTNQGIFDLETKSHVSISEFISKHRNADLFVKPIDGECGCGIMHLVIEDGELTGNGIKLNYDDLSRILSETRYLLQSTIRQHPLMSRLHPESLNTIRLVTIRNPKTGEPDVFPSILRIGTGKSIVDNTSQGGLAVGINLENGKLKDYGFYKPSFGTKVSIHPDSNVKFSEFTIPFFEECKRQAVFLHSMLPSIHSIGWDIAVGPSGPIFVEGNDNWEINGPQICNGGLKKLFLSYCQ